MPAVKVFLHPFDSFGLPTMTTTFQSWVWLCLLVLKPNFKGENIIVLEIWPQSAPPQHTLDHASLTKSCVLSPLKPY